MSAALADLFDPPPLPRVETPAARQTDPTTSHLAAERVTRTGQRQRQIDDVHAALLRHPYSTAAELAHFEKFDRFMVSRRLPDLRTAGRCKNGPARPCRITGNPSVTWSAL